MITMFSGSLFLFSRAFISHGTSPRNFHPASLNSTKSHESSYFDSTSSLPTTKPVVALNPMWDLLNSIKIETFDMHQRFPEPQLGNLSQVLSPSLAPVTEKNLLVWNVNPSFYPRFFPNTRAKLRPNHSNKDGAVDNIYDSEDRHFFDHDSLELDPFSAMEESDDRQFLFTFKIWLYTKYVAKISKADTWQASSGVKCWHDSDIHLGYIAMLEVWTF